MVLWPRNDGEMTEFLHWLTPTHSQGLHAHLHTTGYGHISQGRFKSFPIEQNEPLVKVLRYVERNACRPTSSSGPRTGAGAVYGEDSTEMSIRC